MHYVSKKTQNYTLIALGFAHAVVFSYIAGTRSTYTPPEQVCSETRTTTSGIEYQVCE